jgi:hypothetical protein
MRLNNGFTKPFPHRNQNYVYTDILTNRAIITLAKRGLSIRELVEEVGALPSLKFKKR